ncbi:MAG TPA: helix-turn-helix transcriptional regulator, partial [Opitutus sp.]|nr:helix-turn-helix transcriptional regulator [Opitutus sp.]
PSAPPAGGDSAMHRLLLTMPLESTLQHVVQRSGYQRDHLNRLVKKETGLTLGQFRAQRRLSRAKELLARGVKVGDVAGEIGLPDQSYFARWFRRQTGQSPSHWLHAGAPRAPLDLALCG